MSPEAVLGWNVDEVELGFFFGSGSDSSSSSSVVEWRLPRTLANKSEVLFMNLLKLDKI